MARSRPHEDAARASCMTAVDSTAAVKAEMGIRSTFDSKRTKSGSFFGPESVSSVPALPATCLRGLFEIYPVDRPVGCKEHLTSPDRRNPASAIKPLPYPILQMPRSARLVFDVAMTEVKSIIEPDSIRNYVGWESVSLVCIHRRILAVTAG
jgi:hypothetical protein